MLVQFKKKELKKYLLNIKSNENKIKLLRVMEKITILVNNKNFSRRLNKRNICLEDLKRTY